MSTINRLVDSNTHIIWDVPSGREVFEQNTIKRVKSEPSVGTCFYGAMARLFSPQSTTNNSSYSNLQNSFSKILEDLILKISEQEYSKYLQILEEEIPKLETEDTQRLFSQEGMGFYKAIDKSWAQNLINTVYKPNTPQAAQEFLEQIGLSEETLKSYCPPEKIEGFINSQFNCLYDYLFNKYFLTKKTLLSDFMNKTCDPQELSKISHQFQTGPLNEQVSQLQSLIQALSATKYGFKTSSWKKAHGLKELITELKTHGPLIISGKFGKSYYTDVPIELTDKDFLLKKVYGWSTTTTTRNLSRSHIVVLVGAFEQINQNNDGGYVYFIDPNDASDPLHPENDKIYRISYRRLKDNIDTFQLMKGDAIYH